MSRKKSDSGVLLLFFAHGMQVEVPSGTVLCFNPLSLSPEELSTMPDVQVCIGHVLNPIIIFQTKQAVLDIFSNSFLCARHSFETHTDQSINEASIINQISIENSDGLLEFFPIIFDYMRRQYDHYHHHNNPNANNNNNAVIMPYTRYLSLAQLHQFQLACDFLIPGMFYDKVMMMPHPNYDDHNDEHTEHHRDDYGEPNYDDPNYFVSLDPVQENNTSRLLARKEFNNGDLYSNLMKPLTDSIKSNDFNSFRFILLNQFNRLSFQYNGPERHVLRQLCLLPVTPERLNMIITLFDPNQFGGRFFDQHRATTFTLFFNLSVIERHIPRNGIPVKERFDSFERIVRCLVEDFKMPIHIEKYFPNGLFKGLHLMDEVRRSDSWIAFTVYLEYFPERKEEGSAYILASNGHLSMFSYGDHLNADLPFILDKLLPYVSRADLLEARTQLEYTRRGIAMSNHGSTYYDPAVLQTLSNMLDQAIITRPESPHPPPASLN